MYEISIANPHGNIAYNYPLPNLFHAKTPQFILTFLPKINRCLSPLDQMAKSDKGFRWDIIKYTSGPKNTAHVLIISATLPLSGNNNRYARDVRDIYSRPPEAPKKSPGKNPPELGICKTHLVNVPKIFTKQVKSVLQKNLTARKKICPSRFMATVPVAITALVAAWTRNLEKFPPTGLFNLTAVERLTGRSFETCI